MIQHIVLFTPKANLSEDARRAFARITFETLTRCPQVVHFTVGKRVHVDPGYHRNFGDKTYDYAAVIDFRTAEDLVGYLTSPDHDRLGRLFWEMCESTVVVEVQAVVGTESAALDALV